MSAVVSHSSLAPVVRTFDPDKYLKCKQYLESVKRHAQEPQPQSRSVAFSSSSALSLPSTPQRSTAASTPECLESIVHPAVLGDSPRRQVTTPQPHGQFAFVDPSALPISIRFVYDQLQLNENSNNGESLSMPVSARSSPSTTAGDGVRCADDVFRGASLSYQNQRGHQQRMEEFYKDCSLRRDQREYNEAIARWKILADFLVGAEPRGRAALEMHERRERNILGLMRFEGVARDSIQLASSLHVALWLQLDELMVTETQTRTRVTEHEVVCRHGIESLWQLFVEESTCRSDYERTVLLHRSWDLCFPVMYTHETVRRDIIVRHHLDEREALERHKVVMGEQLVFRDLEVVHVIHREDAHRRQIAWYENKKRRRMADDAIHARHALLVLLGKVQNALEEVTALEANVRRYLSEKWYQGWTRLCLQQWMTRAEEGQRHLQSKEQDERSRLLTVEARERHATQQQRNRVDAHLHDDALSNEPTSSAALREAPAAPQQTGTVVTEGDHRARLHSVCSSETVTAGGSREVRWTACESVRAPLACELLPGPETSRSTVVPACARTNVEVVRREPPLESDRLSSVAVERLWEERLSAAHRQFHDSFAVVALLAHRVAFSAAENTARLRLLERAARDKDYAQRTVDLRRQECSKRAGVAMAERDEILHVVATHRASCLVLARVAELIDVEMTSRTALSEDALETLHLLREAAATAEILARQNEDLSQTAQHVRGLEPRTEQQQQQQEGVGASVRRSPSADAARTDDVRGSGDPRRVENDVSACSDVHALIRSCGDADKPSGSGKVDDVAMPPVAMESEAESHNAPPKHQRPQDTMVEFWWSLAEQENIERVRLENFCRVERGMIVLGHAQLPKVPTRTDDNNIYAGAHSGLSQSNDVVAAPHRRAVPSNSYGRLELSTPPQLPTFKRSASRNDKALERWVASKRGRTR